MTCPICKKEVPRDHPDMPFCSKRCRLIDLGNWASEKYAIPAPLQDSDDFEIPDDIAAPARPKDGNDA